jgi:anti-sigma B factor antagonist
MITRRPDPRDIAGRIVMALDWGVDVQDGVVTMRPAGSIDFSSADALRHALNDATARDDVRQIVVDMSEVAFVDSSALGLFATVKRLSEKRGITFRLRRPVPGVTRILRLTNLYSFLVEPSAEDDPGSD